MSDAAQINDRESSEDDSAFRTDPGVAAQVRPSGAGVTFAPTDVTESIPDLAPEDRVFLTAEGYRVKVKAVLSDETSPIGAFVFMLSGSIVGEDGKALRRSSGSPAVHDLRRTHHQMSDAMSDPVIGLTAARLSCVADTVRAEKHRDLIKAAVTGGAGLATAAAQAARKAAEAATKEN